jgi:hypothetical protein
MADWDWSSSQEQQQSTAAAPAATTSPCFDRSKLSVVWRRCTCSQWLVFCVCTTCCTPTDPLLHHLSCFSLGLIRPPPQIHWFSIINSCVIVLLLTGFLATILSRVLKADFVKYSKEDGEWGSTQAVGACQVAARGRTCPAHTTCR